MIKEICEHSVDLNILPFGANILDLGCRGFDFSLEMVNLGHKVCAIDIDDLGTPPISKDGFVLTYNRYAVSDFDGICGLEKFDDPQATRISKTGTGVECYTLQSLSEKMGIEKWDLIKMDVEGSEYEIIMSMDRPMATQLSIEFHLHTGTYGQDKMQEMVDKLHGLGYDEIRHVAEHRYCAGLNYWDSLFILNHAA